MKDWKNYAIFLLAFWCVWLTWRTTPSVVWSANYEQEYNSRTPVYWWWGKNFSMEAGYSSATNRARVYMKDGTSRPARPDELPNLAETLRTRRLKAEQ